MLNSREFDLSTPSIYLANTADSKFLFGPDVYEKIIELYKKGLELDSCNIKIKLKNEGQQVNGNPAQVRSNLLSWVIAEYDAVVCLFQAYLDLSKG